MPANMLRVFASLCPGCFSAPFVLGEDKNPQGLRSDSSCSGRRREFSSFSRQSSSSKLNTRCKETSGNQPLCSSSTELLAAAANAASSHDYPDPIKTSLDLLTQGISQPAAVNSVTFCQPEDLVQDVQDLEFIGQGSQGMVYHGTWHGAAVAVKWSVVDKLDANANELLYGRILCHPNVVQTFDAKVAVLNTKVVSSLYSPLTAQSEGQRRDSGCSYHIRYGDNLDFNMDITDLGHETSSNSRTSAQGTSHASLSQPWNSTCSSAVQLLRANSYCSDEGFGDPMGPKARLADIRDMLAVTGAQPGQYVLQMIMEHCDQGSLLSAIQRGVFQPTSKFGAKVALRALYRTAREVAQGMHHLHSCKIAHGDLKPANVLLVSSRKDRRGFVAKVSDFGLAKYCCEREVADAAWGTLAYMSPERIRHTVLNPASDVYSFGVMLWQMYSGKPPFETLRQPQLMLGISMGTLKPEWPQGSPSALIKLSQWCMSFEAHQRPSFQVLMNQLTLMEQEVRMDGVRLSHSFEHQNSMPGPTQSIAVGEATSSTTGSFSQSSDSMPCPLSPMPCGKSGASSPYGTGQERAPVILALVPPAQGLPRPAPPKASLGGPGMFQGLHIAPRDRRGSVPMAHAMPHYLDTRRSNTCPLGPARPPASGPGLDSATASSKALQRCRSQLSPIGGNSGREPQGYPYLTQGAGALASTRRASVSSVDVSMVCAKPYGPQVAKPVVGARRQTSELVLNPKAGPPQHMQFVQGPAVAAATALLGTPLNLHPQDSRREASPHQRAAEGAAAGAGSVARTASATVTRSGTAGRASAMSRLSMCTSSARATQAAEPSVGAQHG